MTIRHADADALAPSSDETGDVTTRDALRDWWDRWERLPTVVRDRPAAEVLAEERSSE